MCDKLAIFIPILLPVCLAHNFIKCSFSCNFFENADSAKFFVAISTISKIQEKANIL